MKLVIRYNRITNTPHANDWRQGGIFTNHRVNSKFIMLIQGTAVKPNAESFGLQH